MRLQDVAQIGHAVHLRKFSVMDLMQALTEYVVHDPVWAVSGAARRPEPAWPQRRVLGGASPRFGNLGQFDAASGLKLTKV
jgi:hypothetical protein